jgi:hypothetical protein
MNDLKRYDYYCLGIIYAAAFWNMILSFSIMKVSVPNGMLTKVDSPVQTMEAILSLTICCFISSAEPLGTILKISSKKERIPSKSLNEPSGVNNSDASVKLSLFHLNQFQ